jgi:hypothetical protein
MVTCAVVMHYLQHLNAISEGVVVPKSWTDDAPQPVALQDHAHVKDPLSYKVKRFFLGG